ncbi:MAG: DNA methyltransferase [Chloroflexota bacterium]
MLKLAQEKLDVQNKSRANIFNWRGQFTPQFVDYLLDSFSKPGDVIIEPFSGSGTVLLESARKNLSCYGYEINPAAYAMSKFFTFANTSGEERREILAAFEEKFLKLLPDAQGLPLFIDSGEFRQSYRNLIEFSRTLFGHIKDDKRQKVLALNTLFLAESNKKLDLRRALWESFAYTKKVLLSLPYTDKTISANLGDARLVHKACPVKGNIILTSPPYINVFNYHQNYRAIIEETLGIDLLKVAQSEVGSNRKNRANRFKTVVQYCLDMEQALESFWHSLTEGGLIILVIGRESNVRKTPFYNGLIVKDLIRSMGGFYNIRNFERKFTNKFGNNIKEDIIVFEKNELSPRHNCARNVALKYLKTALYQVNPDIKKDIIAVINDIDTIQPSPIFDLREVLRNA